MELQGTYNISAPRQSVWKHLLDPNVLARAMPGCEKLEPSPDGSFRAELKVGIAVEIAFRGSIENNPRRRIVCVIHGSLWAHWVCAVSL